MNARTWAAATFCSYGCGRRSEAFLLRPVIPTTEPGGDLVFFVTASFAGTKKAPEASPSSRREAAFEALRSEASTRSRVESRVGSGDRGPLCLGRGAHSRLDRYKWPCSLCRWQPAKKRCYFTRRRPHRERAERVITSRSRRLGPAFKARRKRRRGKKK